MAQESRTILDIGYFHLKPDHTVSTAGVTIAYAPDTAQLIKLKPGAVIRQNTLQSLQQDGEVAVFTDAGHARSDYVLFRKHPSEQETPLDDPAMESITPLHFAPKSHELMTMDFGLKRYGKEVSQVMIMVDDLGLPSGLQNHLSLLIPEAYRKKLAESPFKEPLLVSERVCRNQGYKLVEKQKKIASKTFTVVRTAGEDQGPQCDTGTCLPAGRTGGMECDYLTSDNIGLSSLDLKGGCGAVTNAVALTRPRNDQSGETPACGVIVAGQIKEAIDHGYDRMITVHHRKSDPAMDRKIFDGCAIGTWLWPEADFIYRSVKILGFPQSADAMSEAVTASPYIAPNAFSFKGFRERYDDRLYDEKLAGRR